MFLEAAARRWVKFKHAELLIFRGSLVTGAWIGREKRPCDDLDFLADFPFDEARLIKLIADALSIDSDDGIRFDCSAIDSQPIFTDSDFPGCRLQIPAKSDLISTTIQIDVGFNDPLPFGPVATELKTDSDTMHILTPYPEVGFAWKLHGLVEKEGFFWRIKDLADLWLMASHCELDPTKLDKAINVAFESRDGPLWRLDRLFERNVGRSRGSRKDWQAIKQAMPKAGLPETIAEACDLICPIIEPHWRRYHYHPSIFVCGISLADVEQAIDGRPNFQRYTIPEVGTTFVYRHLSAKAFPDPLGAATNTDFKHYRILRELRGITFDETGDLISRPFPKFDPFNTNDLSILKGAETYEKLDGSLVFPSPTKSGFVMRTRRGPSEISQQAQRYLQDSEIRYEKFMDGCLRRKLTPLFEWCSWQHRIIIDHPKDRLILTSIRDNYTGSLLPRDQQEIMADDFQVPIVQHLGEITDPNSWFTKVTTWKNREGCIAHTKNGEVVKIKSTHYKRLHHAIEGPNRDRARWQLFLNGDADSLMELSRWKGLELDAYHTELFDRITDHAEMLVSKISKYPDRKTLAEDARELSGLERQIHFRLYDQAEPIKQLQILLTEAIDESLTRFNEVANLINGPLLND